MVTTNTSPRYSPECYQKLKITHYFFKITGFFVIFMIKIVMVTDKKGGVTGHVTRYKTCVAIKMITDSIYVTPRCRLCEKWRLPQTPSDALRLSATRPK